MNERIRALKPYPMVELARRKRDLLERGVDVLDFGTGDPVEPTPEFIRGAFRRALPEVSQYPTIQGQSALRAAFAAWYDRRFGVHIDPERECIPTRGSKEAVFHLPLVLVDPSEQKRGVVYPVPGYPVMEIGSLYAGADTFEFKLDASNDYCMDPAQVPTDVLRDARIVWLNYPHNPTGQDLPEHLWRAWCDARREHGFVLCSDECYVDLWFGDKPRSLLEFDREGCLVFHSLSKRSGMTGYRSGMVAGDAELIGLYQESRAGFGQAMPVPTQEASREAWSDDVHAEERRRVFGDKRAVISEGLRARGIEVLAATSTFYVWAAVPEGDTGESYAARLLDVGIVVSPGSFFGPGNEGWFRLALVPSVDGCKQAIERWV
jgi:succinyldiaminopimelate transaminase